MITTVWPVSIINWQSKKEKKRINNAVYILATGILPQSTSYSTGVYSGPETAYPSRAHGSKKVTKL